MTSEDASLYPPSPAGVPPDLTQAGPAYRRRAWMAAGGIVAFVALYLGLTCFFGWGAYRQFRLLSAPDENVILRVALGLPAAFFALFLLRGLFGARRADNRARIEVTEDEQPKLFRFIHRIADEAGAPRPHRVFLSAEVNAAVFYDLHFWNLVFPTKKNLEIGLGLITALTLDEAKAVVAHEFGHFAQRSMAVGRWVYLAQEIAGRVVAARGFFDDALHFISTIDIRVAWIGWIMRVFVWALRAVLDTAFRLIVLTHRALSREMELQADLVAASLSGSDSLVHALSKLNEADAAWGSAVDFASGEVNAGRGVEDVFALQASYLEHSRAVLGDPTLGMTPSRPKIERETHRVFDTQLAQPPRMWSTHPPNREREDNVKRRYLKSTLDPRPATALLENEPAVRREITALLFTPLNDDAPPLPDAVPLDETLARLDASFDKPWLDPAYRGAYLNRSVVRAAADVDALYEDDDSRVPAADVILTRIDALFPESLADLLETHRERATERRTLEALRDGVLDAPGGVIRHRGAVIGKTKLPGVIDALKAEETALSRELEAHDRSVRTAYRLAARHFGDDWEEAYEGLVELLHFTAHGLADLIDAQSHCGHVLDIVLADGQVSGSERRRLIQAGREVVDSLRDIYRAEVFIPEDVQALILDELEELRRDTEEDTEPPSVETLEGLLGQSLGLVHPNEGNLGDWLSAADSWCNPTRNVLALLADATLEALLNMERMLEGHLRDGTPPEAEAPEPGEVPEDCTVLVPGGERERQRKLDLWDRFQIADGFWPGAARFAAAATLLAPSLLLLGGGLDASPTVYVHNGLDIPISVEVGDWRGDVQPHRHVIADVESGRSVPIAAYTEAGEPIERFVEALDGSAGTYIYNVAAAAPLVAWTATYGSNREVPAENPNTARWRTTYADDIFVEPPEQISTSSRRGGGARRVLSTLTQLAPWQQAQAVLSESPRRQMILSHVRWTPEEGPALWQWVGLASQFAPGASDVIEERLLESPGSIPLLTAQTTLASEDERTVLCEQRIDARHASPADPDLLYLALHCADLAERTDSAIEAHERFPDHPWLRLLGGNALARGAAWDDAEALLSSTREGPTAAVFSTTAVTLARVRRARQDNPAHARMADLLEASDILSLFGAGELWGERRPELAPYWELARGQLTLADIDAQGVLAEERPRLVRLLAASDGASVEALRRESALPPDAGIDNVTVWPSLVRAREQGRSTEALMAHAAEALTPEALETMLNVLDRVLAFDLEAPVDPHALDDTLRGATPELRGKAMAMACVALGPRTPPAWRRLARALLFVSERPYFAPPDAIGTVVN
ncbi:MAG: M48 family metalloprotease [Sandaracinaceae bacterium]